MRAITVAMAWHSKALQSELTSYFTHDPSQTLRLELAGPSIAVIECRWLAPDRGSLTVGRSEAYTTQ
jgi:hypothetical protein